MVLCPVCKKENNDEEYCTDCGTKLVNIIKDPIIKLDENEDISKVNELKIYFEEMNKKIIQQKKFLDELNNDPLIKKYETLSEINEENNNLKNKIEELEQINEKNSLKLKDQKKEILKLESKIHELKNKGIIGKIGDLFGNK